VTSVSRTKKNSTLHIPRNATPSPEVLLSETAELVIPPGYRETSSPLEHYIRSHSRLGPTLLSRFDDSLIDATPNTRKAYNTDVWVALVVKLFRNWDFPQRYNDLASELIRLEALRRLGTKGSCDSATSLNPHDPLREAVRALSDAQTTTPPSPQHPLSVEAAPDSHERFFTMSLRGSLISTIPNSHLERVTINSTDKQIIHYLFSRFDGCFDTGFWNHFFSLPSLGRIFREQEAGGNSPTTLARKMASLQRFEEFLHRSHLLTAPNLFMQRRPRVTPSAQVVLKGDELKQIESYLDNAVSSGARKRPERETALLFRDRAMFSLLDQYLIRASALCNLTLRDIDLRRGTMRVAEKGRKERVYPLEGGALQALKDYLHIRQEFLRKHPPVAGQEHFVFHTVAGKPMNSRSLSRIIDQRAEEAGIKAQVGSRSTIGAHVIRRSGGARYIEAGARVEAVSQVMNHSNIATTWRYVGNAAMNLSEEVFKKR
jgi:integrase/recombinase XerC